MKDRNVKPCFKFLLHFKTLGRLDVFKIYAPESRRYTCTDIYQPAGILFIHLDVENIDICKNLEKKPFPFHNRFTGKRTDVAQAKHRGTV